MAHVGDHQRELLAVVAAPVALPEVLEHDDAELGRWRRRQRAHLTRELVVGDEDPALGARAAAALRREAAAEGGGVDGGPHRRGPASPSAGSCAPGDRRRRMGPLACEASTTAALQHLDGAGGHQAASGAARPLHALGGEARRVAERPARRLRGADGGAAGAGPPRARRSPPPGAGRWRPDGRAAASAAAAAAAAARAGMWRPQMTHRRAASVVLWGGGGGATW